MWQLWVLFALALVGLGLVALWSIRLDFHVEGRGTPDGAWAVAGAVKVGPMVFSFVESAQAKALSPDVKRNRSVNWKVFGKGKKLKPPSLSYTQLLDWGLFVTRERRRVRVRQLELELLYGFSNVALTGKVAAALYAISGVLPPPIRFEHFPRWSAEDRAEFKGKGTLKVALLSLLWDTAAFMLRAPKRTATRALSESTSESKAP